MRPAGWGTTAVKQQCYTWGCNGHIVQCKRHIAYAFAYVSTLDVSTGSCTTHRRCVHILRVDIACGWLVCGVFVYAFNCIDIPLLPLLQRDVGEFPEGAAMLVGVGIDETALVYWEVMGSVHGQPAEESRRGTGVSRNYKPLTDSEWLSGHYRHLRATY